MPTTTRTNASLADAVSLFLLAEPLRAPAVPIRTKAPSLRSHPATREALAFVPPFVASVDAALDLDVDYAFGRLERGLH